MVSYLAAKLTDPVFMAMILMSIAGCATVLTLAMPFLESDNLGQRMKAVALEREKIRARERERMNASQKVSLRQESKAYMRRTVEKFKLSDWLGTDDAKKILVMAGYRSQASEVTFLFFRLVVPIVFLVAALFYVFVVDSGGFSIPVRLLIIVGAAFAGVKAPEFFLKNVISKRQLSVRRAWPDALDLLLICVESGMSIEHAFKKVSQEIGDQSLALAEELTLTTAELSYLPQRRMAYENLASRTGLETVKSVTTALIQAERYGTPLGQALRVLSQESRDQRMNDAEKKAASLPPKLTVPMILFFLPVLFVIIMTPAIIQVYHWK